MEALPMKPTYEVFDTDTADVLGTFDTLDAAKQAAAALVTERNNPCDDIVVFTIGPDGVRRGPLWASDYDARD